MEKCSQLQILRMENILYGIEKQILLSVQPNNRLVFFCSSFIPYYCPSLATTFSQFLNQRRISGGRTTHFSGLPLKRFFFICSEVETAEKPRTIDRTMCLEREIIFLHFSVFFDSFNPSEAENNWSVD